MTETVNLQPEALKPFAIETVEAAASRLAHELEVIPAGEVSSETIPTVSYMATKNPVNGSYMWSRVYGEKPVVDHIRVDPTSHAEDGPVFEAAVAAFRDDELTMKSVASQGEGRWWGFSHSEAYVDANLTEAFRIHEGENQVDILNCTPEPLTESDTAAITNAFNAVANFTGSKVFERVAGILLLPTTEFKEGVAGDYNPASGVVRINVDDLHNRDPEQLKRYEPYFKPGQTTWAELIIAHELGHTMDISTLQEADLHDVDRSSYWWMASGSSTHDFSAFDNKFGWTNRVGQTVNAAGKEIPVTEHSIDEEQELACNETAPTDYARSHAREDFAETFAIAALGGDLSLVPKRHETVIKTVQLAESNAQIGPKQVSLERIMEPDQLLKKLQTIELRAFVAA